MPKSNVLYMDYASSAEPNPNSIHDRGVVAKARLENARKVVASLLSARPAEVIFTSGGTESNNLALLGIINNFKNPHIVTTNIEHASVMETCLYLQKTKQADVTFVPVEKNGIVDPKKIKKALRPNTALVTVMYANNEIGTVQPIREIAKEIRHYRKIRSSTAPAFHTDAVQAVNYLDLNVEALGVDLLTLSGSKIEKSGRVGVLYKKNKVPLVPLMHGGDQEHGLRPGTENVVAVTAFAAALLRTRTIRDKEAQRLSVLRDYFLKKIKMLDTRIIVNGDLGKRLPNNINITMPNIPSDLLVIELSARSVMVSAKSACKSGDGKDSHVIRALRMADGLSAEASVGSLRFSLGHDTTKTNIDYAIRCLKKVFAKLKKWYT